MEKIKVLLFAANPRGTQPLDLPREFREIDEEVRLSAFRSAVELILVPGTRPKDLLRKLNENQPQVVHFSSHGNADEIILESEEEEAEDSGSGGPSIRSADERDMKKLRPDEVESEGVGHGQHQVVSKSSLVSVLRSCDEGNLRLVVLNACDTRALALALIEIVDCVVSMNQTITDRAAIMFAASFYGALASGRSVQKAFDQGVARLSAEGIDEVETPELLTRRGVDAAQLVLVGSATSKAATPAPEAPFIVPFPRNPDFVGRDVDLARLHASLSGHGPVGIRPAGLTGMGGVGKTQLAVEYVHRHRTDFPDGIFWIDAAGPLAEGFARLATDPRLGWTENDRPRDEQIREAFFELNRRPGALLVLDNLPDPATLAAGVHTGCTPEDLACHLLFTTRRHDLGRFPGVEVSVLPEDAALRLLLRHPSRLPVLDPLHPDHEHARAIARMLGRLPLALELAGAYLGKFSGDVSLADYRSGLKADGALATLDADAAELSGADLRRVHDPAVAATIGEQWQTLQDESAQLLLRVASLFPESAALPMMRLGLLAGLGDEARSGRPSPLRRTVRRLDDACLVERLEGDQLRLHPLIREFAARQTLPEQAEEFRRQCTARAATGLEDFAIFEALEIRRGVDGLQEDLIAILELCPPSASELGARLQALLRLLQREANNLRIGDQRLRPTQFAQQVRNRAFLLGIGPLRSSAELRLTAMGEPHFRLLWKTSHQSRALVRRLAVHTEGVTTLALTPDGSLAVSASFFGSLALSDLPTGRLQQTFDLQDDPVTALAVTPDGRCVLSNSCVGLLRLWDIRSGQLLRSFGAHDALVTAVAMSPDGQHALSACNDGTLRLWDLATERVLQNFVGHDVQVTAVAVTPDGRHVLSSSYDLTLKFWDIRTGQLLRTFAGHGDWVTAVAISPDGRTAISGSHDRTLMSWDLATGKLLQTFVGHGAEVTSLALTPDGRNVISGSYDRTLRLWDLATGPRCIFTGHEQWVTAVAVTPDGRYALSGALDLDLILWDLEFGEAQHVPTGHDAAVTGLAMTPDDRHVLSASSDRKVKLWDLSTGQLRLTLTGHEDSVSAVAVTPDGRHALSASHDCTLGIWDLKTRQLLRTCTGHLAWVTSVAVTPDGANALSGSYDGTLKLWDLATAQLRLTFAGHNAAVTAVAICPDGRLAHFRAVRMAH